MELTRFLCLLFLNHKEDSQKELLQYSVLYLWNAQITLSHLMKADAKASCIILEI